jgi:glyoxylase-like metal-dependent hydrolase (beta-lactamase superfamily II)
MALGMGSVNCYLLSGGNGYVLIDTGAPNAQAMLRTEMECLGCVPGSLNLIVLTHGDFDHTGNAAYIRSAFRSQIAMHADDAGMAEHGDMFANRKKSNSILKFLAPRLIGFGKTRRFVPDVFLRDNSALSEYGLEARVVEIPGHSKGSIGILTAGGELFCGDLFENTRQPALGSIMDDVSTAIRSAERLRSLGIGTVYPGHGKPFSMDQVAVPST